ncbi:aminotransferase class V-fold PLP-dependent enzyme [Candidatus Shikimatogenerans silvanidophilus]|uniref:aminotransferase class V-fold PLP-dependent enzyme n=1 Tax=Candidatus Shikimatogenerans silvanidophilus TaxID=2782547 RepID=UPI001BA6ACC9|nr:SufS family cysteine desulfurase [Candidatus Shikimatogenerans silvanidophilus]
MIDKKKLNYIRKQFPIFNKKIFDNKNLVYFDNASTTQKPYSVIKSIEKYYKNINSNVHRGSHYISNLSTLKIEKSRKIIQKFINASYNHEIIFTKGTTDSINLIALGIKKYIKQDDIIIISQMEHHSNIIPWQNLCKETKSKLEVLPLDKNYNINLSLLDYLLEKKKEKVKIISLVHISNVIGLENNIKKIINKAHKNNTLVLIDGAQSLSHTNINVKKFDIDFYVFSSHKIYGPTGLGILYGKEKLLKKISPIQFGGGMVKNFSFNLNKIEYEDLPLILEPGTPNISSIISFSESIKFINKIGINNIKEYENKLLKYALYKLSKIDNIFLYGKNIIKYPIISFNIKNYHPFDIGMILDKYGIAVRTGNHCAQPFVKFINKKGTIRISLSFYNTYEEIDYLYNKLLKSIKILSKI